MRECRAIYARANMIARQFYMCTERVKVKLFQTFFSTLYTAQLWWKYSQSSLKKLTVAYNNSFRLLFNISRYESASGMLTQRSINGCCCIIRKLIYRFMLRLNKSENTIIKDILKSDMIKKPDIWKHWTSLLLTRTSETDILTITQ